MGNIYYEFIINQPLKYKLTGKSMPKQDDWIHFQREVMTDYELILVTDGVMHISNGKTNYEAKKGEFLIFPQGVPQFGTKPSFCNFYWLHFIPHHELRITDKSAPRSEDSPYLLTLPAYGNAKNPERLVILMKQLQDSIRSYNDPVQNDYMTSAVLCELFNQTMSAAVPGAMVLKRQQLYNDIVDYVKWFEYINLKVTDVAQHFGYNEKYLSHLFCSLSGVSLKQYILREKMERAKFLLTDTNDSVRLVAEKLGFGDSHNFMKAFKKSTGVTPSEYRSTYAKRILNMFYEDAGKNDALLKKENEEQKYI